MQKKDCDFSNIIKINQPVYLVNWIFLGSKVEFQFCD